MIESKDNMKEKTPEGWNVVRLGDVCRKITDGTHSTPKYQEEGIPFISTDNIVPFKKGFDFSRYKRFISEKEHNIFIKRCKPEKGDILISKCGTIGRTKLVDVNYEFSIFVGLALLKLNYDLVVGNFLEQLLNFETYIKQMEISAPGSTRRTLTIGAIRNLRILLPPLPEQSKIAEILETVENAIEKTDKIIEKYERIKKGLMQDLLTKGIDENWQIRSEETHKFKDSKLGRIPEEWEVVRLGDVAKIKTGDSNVEDAVEDGKYPLFDRSLEIKRSDKYLFDTEAVIVPGEGADFKPKYYKGKFDLHQRAYAIFDFKGINGKFLYYLKHILKRELIRVSVGTTVISLRLPHFQNLDIPLPPLPEQQRIALVLSQIDEVIEKEKAYKEKLERIKKGLMEDLLTGKVRVNHLIEENKTLEGVENV